MKNISKFAVASMLCTGALLQTGCQQQKASPAIPSDPQIEENIKQWLDKMTLEEKIGQMCQITIDVVTDFDASQKNGFTLDKAKLDTVIGKYKVGSLLNVPLSVAQTKEKWAEAIRQIQEVLDEGNRNPLHLWCGPDSWNDLYTGRNPVPSRGEHGCHFQPGAGETGSRNIRLREQRQETFPGHSPLWSTSDVTRAGRACGRTSGKTVM